MPTNTENLPRYYLTKNLLLAWPLAMNALLMQAMLVVDILLVSPLGERPLAAMGIATTIVAFFLGVQLALANGSQLLISRAFGANNTHALTESTHYGLAINLFFSVVFVLLLQFFGGHLIGLLATDQSQVLLISEYLSVSQYILLVNGVSQSMIAFFNGQSKTKIPFRAYILELPFNIVLSYFLIYGIGDVFGFTGLGLIGAAFGSLGAILLRLMYLCHRARQGGGFSIIPVKDSQHCLKLKAHLSESLPIAINFVVLSIGYTVYQLLFSQLNIYSYVAVTLVFPWLKMATLFIVAWAQANSITISQAIGKNLQTHIAPIINSCIKAGMLMACVVAFLLYGFSLSVEFFYPNINQQTYLALASIAPLYIVLPLVRTYNTIAGNSLRAIGKSVQVLMVHFTVQWLIVLPLCALFILYLELPLFWAFALLPIEEAIKFLPFYLMLRKQAQ